MCHRITIEENQPTRDGIGGTADNWVPVATVWAAVEPLKGREFFAAQQVNSEVSHRVTLRYRAGVRPDMRVRFGARVLEIAGPPIDPDEKHKELQLMCVERGGSDAA
jgi:SPP1 family predicted phage head-tail adaptor